MVPLSPAAINHQYWWWNEHEVLKSVHIFRYTSVSDLDKYVTKACETGKFGCADAERSDGPGAAMVDVLGCLPDAIRVHLYGLPWRAGPPAAGCHQDPEGAIIRLAATGKVGSRVQGSTTKSVGVLQYPLEDYALIDARSETC